MTDTNSRLVGSATGRLLWHLTSALLVVPLVAAVAALVVLWRHGIGAIEIGLFMAMYGMTTAAVTVGLHRHLAHLAFRAHTPTTVILAIMGSMAMQGPVIQWAATHRRHHTHPDMPGDPHSPHLFGTDLRSRLRGLWYAHVGWLFDHEFADATRYAPDLLDNAALRKVNDLYFVWAVLGLALPALAGGLLAGTWTGALQGFLWGGLVRVFLLQHATFSVNSICHVFGRRTFDTRDRSTNNVWLALISFGEAWHNNHHAFPRSARFGLTWWQVDVGSALIRTLAMTRLAWDVREPTVQQRAAAVRRHPG
jgi:stearoyl-CoA desaturase (delta-9 desaturase)